MADTKRTPALWWKEDKDEVHRSVFSYVDALEDKRHSLEEVWYWNAKLYDNRGDLLNDAESDPTRAPTVVSENYIKNAVDALAATVARARSKASFQTTGGDWETQRKAKLLDQYVEGMFTELDYYQQAPLLFRDAELFGTGVFHFYIDWGKKRICLERVWIGEIYVDERACKFSKPQQLSRKKRIDREVLKDKFADDDNADKIHELIDKAQAAGHRIHSSAGGVDTDQIEVIESWVLGRRHTICIENGCLLDEEYKPDFFPFEFLYFTPPTAGFFGTSLVEEVAGTQLRIHKLNEFVDDVHDRIVRPRVYVHVSDMALQTRINRTVGQIVGYKTREPIFHTPSGVGGEIFQRLNDLRNSIYETSGISKLAAQSKKPAELESAKALREFTNIHAERHALNAQWYEDIAPRTAKHIIRLSRELYKAGAKPAVNWKSRNVVKRIPWDKVDMEEDQYLIDVGVSSILSKTPAARLADVEEWFSLGWIDEAEAMRLLDHPDLRRHIDLETAAKEDIEATIEEILEIGPNDPFIQPKDYQSLELGIKTIQQAMLLYGRSGAPQHVMEAFQNWVDIAASKLQEAAMAAQAAAQGEPGGQQGATPMQQLPASEPVGANQLEAAMPLLQS